MTHCCRILPAVQVGVEAMRTSSVGQGRLMVDRLTSKQDQLIIICCQHGVVAHLRSMS